MSLWRCHNEDCSADPHGRLIFDFEADKPVCPKCGADPRKPEFRETVVRLETMHLLVKDANGPIFERSRRLTLACKPGAKLTTERASMMRQVVNCPSCKRSAAFREAPAVDGNFDDADFDVDVDTAKGEIRKV